MTVSTRSTGGDPSFGARSGTLLITIGSTLFPSLTDLALSPAFLSVLPPLGVKRLMVQYGKSDLVLPPECRVLDKGKHPITAGRVRFTYPLSPASEKGVANIGGASGQRSLEVEAFRYTDDFEGAVRDAQWVISHAGSGSILTVLRAPRPLLVVPNTSLMDNHQAELAEALGRERYLRVCTVADLSEALPDLIHSRPTEIERFPDHNPQVFRDIMDETAGYKLRTR